MKQLSTAITILRRFVETINEREKGEALSGKGGGGKRREAGTGGKRERRGRGKGKMGRRRGKERTGKRKKKKDESVIVEKDSKVGIK